MLTSIIIPTHNRKQILKKCLGKINQQNINLKSVEVIVVDDGSFDRTYEDLSKTTNKYKFSFKIIRQDNLGQGNARNNGLKHAKGEIIIFIGDDILIDKNFVSEHMKFHEKYKQEESGVLGLIKWSPEIKITPFMNWLTNGSNILGKFGGHQFAYEKLKSKKLTDYNFFYTSNISLKKELLNKEKFDPDFGSYGWEDIELGYRLEKKHNFKLYYNKDAIGYHYHEITEKSLKERMRAIGSSAHIIQNKHPELKKVPDLKKKIIFYLLSNFLSLTLLKIVNKLTKNKFLSLYYYALSKKYFLQGINS